MDHVALSQQIRNNLHYMAGPKTLAHKGKAVPYAPAEVVADAEFADGGGGVLDPYSWAATCHADDFTTTPQPGDTATVDGETYAIARVGRVKETGEIILYFDNPDSR